MVPTKPVPWIILRGSEWFEVGWGGWGGHSGDTSEPPLADASRHTRRGPALSCSSEAHSLASSLPRYCWVWSLFVSVTPFKEGSVVQKV